MLRLRTGLLLLGICFAVTCFAQTDFTPLKGDKSKLQSSVEAVTARYKADLSSLSGPNKKFLGEIYKERFEMIKKMFDEEEILIDKDAHEYLLAIVSAIIKANPELHLSELRPVFSKTWVPNAYSMGEGTIVFNMGLFHRLDNESQAAFVLCHELAHYYLDHSNRGIYTYVNTVFSDEFQKKLKSIQKKDYGQNKMVEDLAKSLSFRSRRYSREFEEAADSLGVEFMKRTDFDVKESLTALALLDSVDKDKYNYPLALEKRFNFAGYAFKPSWTSSNSLSFASSQDELSEAEKDSLKTHPDCKLRIERLRATVNTHHNPASKQSIIDPKKFEFLKNQFDFEILEYCFSHHEVSRCLYYCLEMLNKYPDHPYLHAMVGRCLNEIYQKQKAHELGKIVDLPSPEYGKEYNQLLNMIQNLRLVEISSLSYYFLAQFEDADRNNSYFNSAWQTSKQIFNQ